ncbi:MAG: hypothetical protein H0T86_16215 [Gemmatimonadales bacterium]|nr:hypothetical protein [Gemmatimonadales bacterium]
MYGRPVSLLAAAMLLAGCSEPTGPAAGTFEARLSGALAAALSGPSNGDLVYSEALPEGRYTISMVAAQGDSVRLISIQFPGQVLPTPGTYAVSALDADSQGRYSLLASGLEVVERASAAAGSVTIGEVSQGQAVGTFSFSGTLVAGPDTTGTVTVAGAFSATLRS